jgi:hypothetical protein
MDISHFGWESKGEFDDERDMGLDIISKIF